MSRQFLIKSSQKTAKTPGVALSPPVSARSPLQPLSPPILQLQRILGNRRVAQLIQASRLTSQGKIVGLQRKLTVGAADDQYEQEADQVARQVMSMPDAAPAHTIQPEETQPIQAKSAGSLTDSFEAGDKVENQLNRSKGGGTPLPDAVRGFMEPRFGMDFSQVRAHTGSEAIQMNRDVGATAFTHGSDIYYGAGQNPGNLELTAHELTHVVQQTGGALQPKRRDRIAPANVGDPIQRTRLAGSSSSPLIQRDKIPHGSLTWDDFQGKVPKKAKHDAATYSDFEDPELKSLIPDNAPVDTGEPCTAKGKDLTKFAVDITIDSSKAEVKSFMDQDKSWHKAWTTDEAARKIKCKKEWSPKCKKAFDKQIARIKKETKKQCKSFQTQCKAAFKKGGASFVIEIEDTEIEANSAKECTSVLLPGCIAAFTKAGVDQITWEAGMGGTSVTVNKREDCSTTFVDECAADLMQAGSDELLQHEQTHFDLTQAMAEKAQNDLRELVETFPTQVDACGEAAAKAKAKKALASELAKMKKSYTANKNAMSKKQKQYDKETKHGIVEKQQTAWEEKISEGF